MNPINIFKRNKDLENGKLESIELPSDFTENLMNCMFQYLDNIPINEKVVVKRIEDALKKYKDGDTFWYLYIPGFNDYINKIHKGAGLTGKDFSPVCWQLVVESFEKEDSDIIKKKNKKIQCGLNELAKKINDDPSQLISINEITDKVEPYTNQTDEENINNNQKEHKIDVSHFLDFMTGDNKLKGERIMNEKDHKRLVKSTNCLVNEQKVLNKLKALPKINLTKQEIIYTYSRIHDHVYPNGKLRKEFFIFLDKMFSQLHQPDIHIDKGDNYLKSYSYKKFREKPLHYDKYYI